MKIYDLSKELFSATVYPGDPAPENTSNHFTDVPAGKYYTDAVLWAVEKGITDGTDDVKMTFSPDEEVTNAQMLAFTARTKEIYAYGESWDQLAMEWAADNGLLEGLPAAPVKGNDCPRSDVVFFLWHLYA